MMAASHCLLVLVNIYTLSTKRLEIRTNDPCPFSEKIESQFDLSIALTLHSWSALTLAVQNSWGGPLSGEKRDWFAGAISDLFQQQTSLGAEVDVDYLDEFLIQVMNDEFELQIEDGSSEEVAAKIVGLRALTRKGDFSIVEEMKRRWDARRGVGESIGIVRGKREDDDDDDDDDDVENGGEDNEDNEEWNGFDEMDIDRPQASPALQPPREKVKPIIDDDGFTKVIGKKRR